MTIKRQLKILVFGIMAGLSIAIGGAAYTAGTYYGSEIVGSFLFSLGLLLVCTFSFKLYTGQIGKVFENRPKFLIDLLVMYLGNFIGATMTGLLLSAVVPSDAYEETIMAISESKLLQLNDIGTPWYELLISSFFCGILVFLGVEIFNKAKNDITKVTGLILCVTVFVLCGFQHCIANMFYLSNSLYLFIHPFESIFGILTVTLGNSLGAIFIWFMFYLFKRLSSDEENENASVK